MNDHGWLLIFILLSSLIPGIIIFALPEKKSHLRVSLNLLGSILKIVLILIMNVGIFHGKT